MTTDLHVATGAYVCGALDADELRAARGHLGACLRCAAEASSLVETVTLLGLATATTPPPGLRAQVLAMIARTPQLPELAPPEGRFVQAASRRAAGIPRWTMAAAASLIVLSVGLGAARLAQRPEVGRAQALQTGQSVTVVRGAVSATVTRTADHLLSFAARGLRDLGTERTYEIWLVDDRGPRPAGTFGGSGGRPTVIGDPGRARTLTVTEEPAGGSASPTSTPVLVLDLPWTT